MTMPDLRRANLVRLLSAAVSHYELNTCAHEDTHRGGIIWTICDSCEAKWADDEGGFVAFVELAEIIEARSLLALADPTEKA